MKLKLDREKKRVIKHEWGSTTIAQKNNKNSDNQIYFGDCCNNIYNY